MNSNLTVLFFLSQKIYGSKVNRIKSWSCSSLFIVFVLYEFCAEFMK